MAVPTKFSPVQTEQIGKDCANDWLCEQPMKSWKLSCYMIFAQQNLFVTMIKQRLLLFLSTPGYCITVQPQSKIHGNLYYLMSTWISRESSLIYFPWIILNAPKHFFSLAAHPCLYRSRTQVLFKVKLNHDSLMNDFRSPSIDIYQSAKCCQWRKWIADVSAAL